MKRVRTGVAHDHDGWWVIMEFDGVRHHIGKAPDGGPFATEAEAEDACALVVEATHQALDDAGLAWEQNPT